MNHKKLLCCALAFVLGGCVPVMSLHPLFTEEDTVFEKKLLGTWVDDPNSPDGSWEFSDINEPKNAYKLILTDEEGKKGSFVARLVKLQDKLFMDVYPTALPSDVNDPGKMAWPLNLLFLIPAHTFLKIDSMEPTLKIRLTLESEMKKLLAEDPNAVEHTLVDDRLVLTASTKELRAFVLKYANDDRLFTSPVALVRK